MQSVAYQEIIHRIPLLTPEERKQIIGFLHFDSGITDESNICAAISAEQNRTAASPTRLVPLRSFDEERKWVSQHHEQYRGQFVALAGEDLGKMIERQCRIRSRDALHVASAMLGGARYFLSCDRLITEMKQARCYRRLTPPARQTYFSAMNPRLFAQKLKKGEIE